MVSSCVFLPDLVIITGDITSQATPREFELSRMVLDPLLSSNAIQKFVIPGNHDYYTHGAVRKKLFETFYEKWMHAREHDLPQLAVRDAAVLGLNPCQPNYLTSRGSYKPQEVRPARLEPT